MDIRKKYSVDFTKINKLSCRNSSIDVSYITVLFNFTYFDLIEIQETTRIYWVISKVKFVWEDVWVGLASINSYSGCHSKHLCKHRRRRINRKVRIKKQNNRIRAPSQKTKICIDSCSPALQRTSREQTETIRGRAEQTIQKTQVTNAAVPHSKLKQDTNI